MSFRREQRKLEHFLRLGRGVEDGSVEAVQGDAGTRSGIVADEVGPSLRWATAEITRVATG